MSDSKEIARGVIRIPTGISNAYIVGDADHWTLIDTGTDGYADKVTQVAERRFGSRARPDAILLTHGHFDHSGSAPALTRQWDVRAYAHRMELPYLTGQSKYPPPDPTVGGFMSQVIRFFPNKSYDLGDSVKELNLEQPQSLTGWRVIETPGHTPGHVSFYREEDGVLIAGDAFCTIDQDNLIGMLSKKPQVSRPPAYYTINWEQAHESVRKLAQISPRLLAAGHGEPMGGEEAQRQLRELAENFPAPTYGRYVKQPPVVNEYGVALMPPPVADPVKRVAVGAIVAGTLAAVALILMRRRSDRVPDENEWASSPRKNWRSSPDWRSQLNRDDDSESQVESAAQDSSARWAWRKPA